MYYSFILIFTIILYNIKVTVILRKRQRYLYYGLKLYNIIILNNPVIFKVHLYPDIFIIDFNIRYIYISVL